MNTSRNDSLEARRLQDRAADDLRFIRTTMERAGSFTAVPGAGTLLIGLTALAAAALAARQPNEARWLLLWLAEAAIAVSIAGWTMIRKARAMRVPLFRGSGLRFLFGLLPPFVAAAILTPVLFHAGHAELLPGLWLLLYGTGVVTGGAFSVRLVPAMGLTFMALGAATLLFGLEPRDLLMAIGFGGLHLIYGAIIVRRHGG